GHEWGGDTDTWLNTDDSDVVFPGWFMVQDVGSDWNRTIEVFVQILDQDVNMDDELDFNPSPRRASMTFLVDLATGIWRSQDTPGAASGYPEGVGNIAEDRVQLGQGPCWVGDGHWTDVEADGRRRLPGALCLWIERSSVARNCFVP